MSFVYRLLRRSAGLGALAAAAAVLVPSAAHASLVQPSDCQPTALSQPFTDDPNFYEQVLGPYALSDGDSVVAQPACVNISHPDVRLIVNGDAGATVSVDALFNTGNATVEVPLGSVPANVGISPPIPIDVVNMAALDGENALVTLEFSVHGGSAGIDSAWVDPWRWW
jgi:hypothetical protein